MSDQIIDLEYSQTANIDFSQIDKQKHYSLSYSLAKAFIPPIFPDAIREKMAHGLWYVISFMKEIVHDKAFKRGVVDKDDVAANWKGIEAAINGVPREYDYNSSTYDKLAIALFYSMIGFFILLYITGVQLVGLVKYNNKIKKLKHELKCSDDVIDFLMILKFKRHIWFKTELEYSRILYEKYKLLFKEIKSNKHLMDMMKSKNFLSDDETLKIGGRIRHNEINSSIYQLFRGDIKSLNSFTALIFRVKSKYIVLKPALRSKMRRHG